LIVPISVGLFEVVLRPLMVRLYGGEGLVGSSNIRRAQARTALTVAALMVGVAMIVGISAMTDSFRKDILKWVENTIGGDLYIRSAVTMRPEVGRRLAGVPGVRDVTPLRYVSAKRLTESGQKDKDDLVFVAVDPTTYTKVAAFQFATGQGDESALMQRLAQGNAVFVSNVLADKYGLHQGDYIRLATKRGENDFYIAAVIVDFTAQGFAITGTWNDLRRYFGVNDVNVFIVRLLPEYDNAAVAQYVKDRYGKSLHLSVESSHEFRERIMQVTAQSFGLFNVLVLIGLIVAALGVANTLLMNILERLREIGMLRGLGMTRWQVGKMILAEAGSIGLIGGIFGLVFGLFLSRIFILAMNLLAGYTLHWVFPLDGVLASLIVAFAVSQIAALYPAWRAARVNIVAAIQHE